MQLPYDAHIDVAFTTDDDALAGALDEFQATIAGETLADSIVRSDAGSDTAKEVEIESAKIAVAVQAR